MNRVRAKVNQFSAARDDFRSGHRVTAVLAVLSWVMYVVAAGLASYCVFAVLNNDRIVRSTADMHTKSQSAWPESRKKDTLAKAIEYNDNVSNRFGGAIPGDALDNNGQPIEANDAGYLSTMNDGQGIIGTVIIPSISIEVPIYHTTLETALNEGAGHIYGTAFPIGQNNTSSAIAAHSGGVQGLLFSRLPELKKGGFFYVNVLGSRQGYVVDRVETVKPEEVAGYLKKEAETASKSNTKEGVVPLPNDGGSARVTLMTCTPIGVNSHRLMVSGTRSGIPSPVPEPETINDNRIEAFMWACLVFSVLIVLAVVWKLARVFLPKGSK